MQEIGERKEKTSSFNIDEIASTNKSLADFIHITFFFFMGDYIFCIMMLLQIMSQSFDLVCLHLD